MGGEYAEEEGQDDQDWGPWSTSVDEMLAGHHGALARLELEVIPNLFETIQDRIVSHEAETTVRLEQFWERQQAINSEMAQAQSVHAASFELAVGDKLRVAQLESERMLQMLSQDKENRLRAEMQQARAAQTEYVEKRIQEVVATGAKIAAAETVLAMGAGSGPQAAECTRLMNELHESKFRDIATAIADLKKTVESGDSVYVTRNEMTAIVKAYIQKWNEQGKIQC